MPDLSAKIPWYEEPDTSIGPRILDYARRVEQDLSSKWSRDRLHMRMWGGADYLGFGRTRWERRGTSPARIRYNLAFSIADTVLSTVGTIKPRVRFNTNDGSWGLQRRAKKRELCIHGEFYRNRAYELGPLVFTDGMVTGTGDASVGRRGDLPHIERSLPFEWRVDPYEAVRSEPLTHWRVRPVDRAVLQGIFPDADLSREAIAGGFHDFDSLRHFADLVRDDVDHLVLVEAWRVALDKDRPGKYVAVVGSETLDVQAYTRTSPPKATFRWQDRQGGYWGRGLCEILRPYQESLNYVDEKIGQILHKASNVKVYTFGEGVTADVITNDYVDIHQLGGQDKPPLVVSNNVVPPELWQQRAEIIRQAFEAVGVSEQRVAGKKPSGVISAVGQREANEIADQRQQPKAQRYEQFYVDLANQVGLVKDELAEEGHDAPVSVDMKRGRKTVFQRVRWKEARLDDADYRVTADPASSLPLQTSARFTTLQEWFGAGLIDRQQFLHLSNVPDLESFTSMELAPMEKILDDIEEVIEDGKQTTPQPTDDLALTIKLMTQAANKFERQGAPQERIDMLLIHIETARQLQQVAAQGAAPQQAAAAQPVQQSQEQILAAEAQTAGATLQ